MAEPQTLFDLPTLPEEFGIVLPPVNLRRLDFSGLDYTTARKAIIEYIITYFPDDHNDFIASNGIMMITEIVAAVVGKLSLRGDILGGESTLPTSKTEEAVVNHLALINQRIRRQTPAVVDVEATVDQPLFTDLEIDAGLSFSIVGTDKKPIVYEIYRAPGDWTGKIVIPASKRGVIAYGIEGQFAAPVTVTSGGGANQRFTIDEPNILEQPIFVDITVGNTTESWRVITEPLERFGPTDKVVEVNFIDTRAVFRFGDDITGQAPLSGSTITFRFRVGGGSRGRIGIGQIDVNRQIVPLPPANAVATVNFRNVTSSIGGTNRESIDQAKQRAPRDFATQRSIVTNNDYAQLASTFSHPVFGTVSKALATIRTSRNANLVEVYVLAEGVGNIPVKPNAGLKLGLATYFSDLNVATDYVDILDGAIKPVDLDMNIIVNRNSDVTIVKENAEAALTAFFDTAKWNMGQPLYLSNLIDVINSIDGVSYVDIFSPNDNILPTNAISVEGSAGIGFNEVIVEGSRKTGYYYERNPPPAGAKG